MPRQSAEANREAGDGAVAALEEERSSQASGSLPGWWRARNLERSFFIFLSASCFFNIGMFMFALLYNLYLLDIGYKEDFLGWMSSATTAGNMVGTVLAVMLTRRIGLQRSVIVCFAATATIAAMRSLAFGEAALLSLAFAAGLFFALWAISITVIVAQVTTAKTRPFAFSVYLSTVIGIGIIAEPAGGHLPGWLNHLFGPTGVAQSKQWALLVSAAIVSVAVWPALYLRLPQETKDAPPAAYPRSSFVVRFLIAIAVLNIATASFNPFANTYFASYMKMQPQHIGFVFSGGQLAQVIAILLSPFILKRFGMIWGIVCMELAAGLSLATLATGPPVLAATLAFAGYMAFQWMDEPAMESLLMTRVQPHERSGASAMMYMVIFASGALAAPVAGAGLARFGYPPIIVVASFLLLLGALLFGFLLRRSERDAAGDAPGFDF